MSVLVHSSDGYSDAWRPFFTLFHKYWPDNPFPVYLCSETKTFPSDKITMINTGPEKEWSERLIMALNKISSKYTLLLLEDYLLYKQVDTGWIFDLIKIADHSSAACMRLFPVPRPSKPLPGVEGIGIIESGAEYRISTQASIWNGEMLRSLLIPSENVWQFETIGSKRSDNFPYTFLSILPNEPHAILEKVHLPYSYVCTGIVKGRWTRKAIALCRSENIPLDLRYRKAKPVWDNWFQMLYGNSPRPMQHALDFLYSRIIRNVPPSM